GLLRVRRTGGRTCRRSRQGGREPMRSLKSALSMVGLALFVLASAGPAARAAIRTHVALQVVLPDGKPGPELPLEQVSAHATVTGSLARVELTHHFGNPHQEPIEALYS